MTKNHNEHGLQRQHWNTG